MGVQPPFIYDAVKSERSKNLPYNDFDPKAVTRASFQTARSSPRRKQEGPLVSFNQHPDSYLILPYGTTDAKPMSPSVKKWIKWMRIIQLVLRCLEFIAAAGLLVFMILIRNVDSVTGWIMRIVPGVTIAHTVYGIYHLRRKPSRRTPGSSASYMLFASFFDCSILPFYAFSALVARTRQSGWTTALDCDASVNSACTAWNANRIDIFSEVVFLLATVGAGLHLTSLVISLYLAVTFRKITKLPPDMNPLEDNLTSRHKRSKSSISLATTSTASTKRLSTPLEAKRSSGAPYEDLSRPPTIPFFHTRTQSTDSFTTYKSTRPGSYRDASKNGSRNDLPSARPSYYALANPSSARSSMVDLKRATPYNPSTPPKNMRAAYQEVPTYERPLTAPRQGPEMGKMTEAWYTNDSLSKSRTRTPSPKKCSYQPVSQHLQHESTEMDDISFQHPNPLYSNPSTPTSPKHGHKYNLSQNSPLSAISRNSRRLSNSMSRTHTNNTIGKAISNDIADQPSSYSHNTHNYNYIDDIDNDNDDDRQAELQLERELTPAPLNSRPSSIASSIALKARRYGDLKPGTPPIMVGGNNRQVSSGNDWKGGDLGVGGSRKREVSGKIAEEGRGFGARFRRISGMGL